MEWVFHISKGLYLSLPDEYLIFQFILVIHCLVEWRLINISLGLYGEYSIVQQASILENKSIPVQVCGQPTENQFVCN